MTPVPTRFSIRLLAAFTATCLAVAVITALQLAQGSPRATHVTLRTLSVTDVLALPSLASPGQPRPERVVVLGDSVATGTGCDCRPFGPRLARLLARRMDRPVLVSTLAQDGLATVDLVSQLRNDPVTKSALRRASVVTVTISANDFDAAEATGRCVGAAGPTSCYDKDVRVLPQRLGDVLAAVTSLAGPATTVLVTGYWNVFLDGVVGARHGSSYQRTSAALTRRINDALRLAAREAGATYVDVYRAFTGNGADVTALLAPDGDHPSAAGHQRIAEALADAVPTG